MTFEPSTPVLTPNKSHTGNASWSVKQSGATKTTTESGTSTLSARSGAFERSTEIFEYFSATDDTDLELDLLDEIDFYNETLNETMMSNISIYLNSSETSSWYSWFTDFFETSNVTDCSNVTNVTWDANVTDCSSATSLHQVKYHTLFYVLLNFSCILLLN